MLRYFLADCVHGSERFIGIRGCNPMRHDRQSVKRIDLAEMQLASSETARIINRDIVLELIRASQPISRADLARRSGLGRSTISFFFSSRRRHTRSVSAFLLNRSSDLV